jgi:hypothetical protein
MVYPTISVRWSKSNHCYIATVGAEHPRPKGASASFPPEAAGRGNSPDEAVRRLCEAYGAINTLAEEIEGA